MSKNLLTASLVLAVVILVGVVGWQQGQRDCEKHFGPILQSRYMPIEGCQIKVGSEWRSERELRNNVQQGLQEMQEGGKKMMEGIFGKEPAAPPPR